MSHDKPHEPTSSLWFSFREAIIKVAAIQPEHHVTEVVEDFNYIVSWAPSIGVSMKV